MTTINPCPFCGHDDVEINEVGPAEYAVDGPAIGQYAHQLFFVLRALVEERQPLGIERPAYQAAVKLIHAIETMKAAVS